MRTSIILSLVLLVMVLAGGLYGAQVTREVSQRYLSAAEELDILTQDQAWERAEIVAEAYLEAWNPTEKWLQIVCNHEDTDALSLALKRLMAGIQSRDAVTCREACWELREQAEHIYHRDTLTWGNVL